MNELKSAHVNSYSLWCFVFQVPAAFAIEAQYTCSKPGGRFVVENREALGDLQNTAAVGSYFETSSPEEFVQTLSDLHLLLYLAKKEEFQSGVNIAYRLLYTIRILLCQCSGKDVCCDDWKVFC